jgi:hypothetical protein
VDYTVTNFGANKNIILPDSRFTVICLDRLNKNKDTTLIYSLSKLRFEPGAYSSLKRYLFAPYALIPTI